MQSDKKNYSQCTGKKYPKMQQRRVKKDLEKHIRRTASYVLEFIITYSPVWMEFQS